MEVKILGMGCSKCNALYEDVRKAASELNLEATVEKVSDIQQMMAYKVLTAPALVIDGTVKVAGRVPKPDELKRMLTEASR